MTAHRHAGRIVAAARGCVGTRFRAQGRRPGLALDCVGVVLVAAGAIGLNVTVPAYRLGGDHEAVLDHELAAAGFTRIVAPEPGDIIAVAPVDGRRHLAVLTDVGVVHAHAGLGRVVEGPIEPAWTLIAAWRLPEEA